MVGKYPLYHQHAELWALISPLDSYSDEMIEWAQLLEPFLPSGRKLELLDLGTGGGHHLFQLLRHLERDVEALGLDLSTEMLRRAKELIPFLDCRQADMTSFALDRRFDVICVHDSFCYLRNEESVFAFFENVAVHLKPEGRALVKLEAVEEGFGGPYRYLTSFEDAGREITLTHYEWRPRKEKAEVEVLYHFIFQSQAGLETREERHRLGLFSRSRLQTLAKEAGMKARFVSLEPWDEERENLVIMLEHGNS